MLEKIMDLHILLYGDTSYLPKTDQKKYRDKNKSQRKVAEPLDDQGQAVKQNEQDGMVPIPSFYRSSGCSLLVF